MKISAPNAAVVAPALPPHASVAASTSLTPVYAKLVAVGLLWGGTFIAGRTLAHELPAMVVAAMRFAVAAALLLALAWRMEGGLPRLDRSQMLATAALGATGIFLYNLCFFGALAHIPAGRAALFVALNPVVTALAAAVILRERLTPRKWAGIALAFVGATIVITRGDLAGAMHDISQSLGVGELLMLGCVFAWAAYTLIGRRALKNLSPIAATTYAAIWGLLFLSVGAAGQLGDVDWAAMNFKLWGSIVYLGAFGTVIGFVWYYEGVKAIGPSRASVFNNLVPVFGVLLAALLLGEAILVSMVVGGLLVVAGVTLTNR
ncbi:MAG TPA: DMT family transporter [Telluria sp.]|nr:DMT family transporter [Telluria sp.]